MDRYSRPIDSISARGRESTACNARQYQNLLERIQEFGPEGITGGTCAIDMTVAAAPQMVFKSDQNLQCDFFPSPRKYVQLKQKEQWRSTPLESARHTPSCRCRRPEQS